VTEDQETNMRFIVMHKVDTTMEAGALPDQRIMQSMSALVMGSKKEGVFLDGAGLHRSARRARVTCSDGACTVEQGPYQGKNELVATVAMIRAATLNDAIQEAQRVGASLGDAEIEIGPVVEAWDLGVMPKPAGDVPSRFLLLCKSDSRDEAGATQKQRAALAQLRQRLGDDLLLIETLAPSSRGARAGASKSKRTWVDGPFAESKELIAGFSILELPSKADALAWADRYAAILVDSEVDVRELSDA